MDTEDAHPARVGVGGQRRGRIGDGFGQRPHPPVQVGAVHEQRPDAIVGPHAARFVDGRGDDPERVIEPVGNDQVPHGESDHDGQDRIAPQRLDRPPRERGGPLGRVAGHRHLSRGDGQLHPAVQFPRFDALAHPRRALMRRATRVEREPRHREHVRLEVHGQRGIGVRAGGQRPLDDPHTVHRVVHPDQGRQRPGGVQPRERVRGRLDPAPQVLDRRTAVERKRFGHAELEQQSRPRGR